MRTALLLIFGAFGCVGAMAQPSLPGRSAQPPVAGQATMPVPGSIAGVHSVGGTRWLERLRLQQPLPDTPRPVPEFDDLRALRELMLPADKLAPRLLRCPVEGGSAINAVVYRDRKESAAITYGEIEFESRPYAVRARLHSSKGDHVVFADSGNTHGLVTVTRVARLFTRQPSGYTTVSDCVPHGSVADLKVRWDNALRLLDEYPGAGACVPRLPDLGLDEFVVREGVQPLLEVLANGDPVRLKLAFRVNGSLEYAFYSSGATNPYTREAARRIAARAAYLRRTDTRVCEILVHFPSDMAGKVRVSSAGGVSSSGGELGSPERPSRSGIPVLKIEPAYPSVAKRLAESGSVWLEAQVHVTGEVLEVQVISSSGSRSLDLAATEAFAKWRFRPTGEAYAIRQQFRFSLETSDGEQSVGTSGR